LKHVRRTQARRLISASFTLVSAFKQTKSARIAPNRRQLNQSADVKVCWHSAGEGVPSANPPLTNAADGTPNTLI
jgi:hypothetical protein